MVAISWANVSSMNLIVDDMITFKSDPMTAERKVR
jgi:hypothetical protein